MVRYYAYKGCGTCRKAKKWLQEQSVAFEELPIRETPPSLEELDMALKSGYALKALFNSSGGDYRELGLKDKLSQMSTEEALVLLHERGNLVKRPFLVHGNNVLVGFKPDVWEKFFL